LRPYVGRMSLPQIGGVLEGMLAALDYAEQRGIVHRDLKPENVMVTASGGVKITDFGIAKATSAVKEPTLNLTATGATLGTPNYIAPEQAMALDLGPGTDLYALGVMTFELFVGRVPFHDTQEPVAIAMRHVNEAIPPVSSLRPDVEPAMSAWIERLLVKDPAGRTASAGRAADELDEILLGVLGPRWRRDAALPPSPAVGGAAVGAAAVAAAVSPPRRPPTHAAFQTMPPTTHRLPPDAPTERLPPEPTRPMRGNRARTTAVAVLALIAIVALLTGFLSHGNGSSQPPAQQSAPASAPVSGDASTGSTPPTTAPTTPSTAAPRTPSATTAPPASTGTTPPAASQSDGGGDEQSDDPSDDAGESGSP
jgi:hypothetical protein